MFNLKDFSDTILELNVLARAETVDRYQEKALAAVQRILPFDMAWWGTMSPRDSSFLLHSSHLFNLPANYVRIWEQTKSDDNVAKEAHKLPRQTAYFDEKNLAAAPGLATLTFTHGIGQACCTASCGTAHPTFTFLSLYRGQNEPRFSAEEQLFKQYLMPHLCSAWAANHAFQIQQLKASTSGGKAAMAVVDRQLEIVSSEAGFRDFVAAEWPQWDGISLPLPILRWLRSAESSVKLDRIVMLRYPFGDLHLLVARRRTRADLLSKREASVAQAFSRGLSYKEVARELDSAPATIRHHLRMVYEKLGVKDKATLTSALRDQNDCFPHGDLIFRHRELENTRPRRSGSSLAAAAVAAAQPSFS